MMTLPPDKILCPECGTEDVNYDVLDDAIVITCSRFQHVVREMSRDDCDGKEIRAWKEAVTKQRQRRELESNRLRMSKKL